MAQSRIEPRLGDYQHKEKRGYRDRRVFGDEKMRRSLYWLALLTVLACLYMMGHALVLCYLLVAGLF